MPIIPATGYHSNCVMVFMSPNTVTTYSLTLAIHRATFVTCCSVLMHGHNYFNGPECILRGKAVVVPPDIGQLQCNMTLVVPADIVCMGLQIMTLSHTDNHALYQGNGRGGGISNLICPEGCASLYPRFTL